MYLENNYKRSFPNDNLLTLLRKVESHGGVVCGGFARWMSGLGPDSPADDVDIYVPNREVESKIINCLGRYQEYLVHTSWTYPDMLIENISTLKHKDVVSRFGFKIQFIRMPFEDPEDILDTFDFPVCKAYLNLRDWTARYTIDYISDITEGKLRYIHDINSEKLYLICTRLSKYLFKGFKLDIKEFYRIKNSFEYTTDKDYFVQNFIDMKNKPYLYDYKNSSIESLTEVLDIDMIDFIETIGNC